MKYDVIAINLETHAERVLTRDKSEADAKTIIKIAVARRGVDEEVYKMVPCESPYSAPGEPE